MTSWADEAVAQDEEVNKTERRGILSNESDGGILTSSPGKHCCCAELREQASRNGFEEFRFFPSSNQLYFCKNGPPRSQLDKNWPEWVALNLNETFSSSWQKFHIFSSLFLSPVSGFGQTRSERCRICQKKCFHNWDFHKCLSKTASQHPWRQKSALELHDRYGADTSSYHLSVHLKPETWRTLPLLRGPHVFCRGYQLSVTPSGLFWALLPRNESCCCTASLSLPSSQPALLAASQELP